MAEWSPEEDATLHRMWLIEGHSAGFIASTMPGRSRNSIIGRVHRMGWSRAEPSGTGRRLAYPGARYSPYTVERKPGRGNSPGSQAARAIGQRKSGSIGPLPTDLKPSDVLSPNAKPWTERAFGECAFPVSGEGAETNSCCNPTLRTYCASHERVMYVASPKPVKVYLDGPRRSKDFKEWAA